MNILAQDFRIAVRSLARTPAFAGTAVISLALAIGINVANFSVVGAVLLRHLPVSEPEQLVRIGQTVAGNGFLVVSHEEYRAVETVDAFSGVAAFHPNSALLHTGGEPFEVAMELVAANYFDVLGASLERGRGFLPQEGAEPANAAVVVISESLWRDRLAADPEAVGRTLRLNGRAFEVVGIVAEGFSGAFPGFRADLWAPLMMQAVALPNAGSLDNPDDQFLHMIGRLRDGSSEAEARAALSVVSARLSVEFPATHADRGFATESAAGVHPALASIAAPFLGLLMVVVGLVLLIAAANISNMVLARAANRRHETAVRLALGAGRLRLFREHLLDALVLTVPGTLLGLLFAIWGRDIIGIVRPSAGLPVGLGIEVSVDARVAAFAVAISLALSLLLAAVPALGAWRAGAARPAQAWASRGRGLLRQVLVLAQVAVSSLLVLLSALLLQTLANSSDLDAGFSADNVALVTGDPSVLGYDAVSAGDLWRDLADRAASLPQVADVALGLFVPLGSRADQLPLRTEESAGVDPLLVNYNAVSEGYFDLLGVPLLRGRSFQADDDSTRADVAVVNRTLADFFWPQEDAIGKRMRVADGSGAGHVVEVVGVVADIKYRRLSERPTPFVYVPYKQWDRRDLVLHVRSRSGAIGMTAALVDGLQAVDPELPLSFGTLSEEMEYSLVVPRIVSLVVGVSAAVGLLLASVGVFASVSYATARRIPEIGVRMVLGANASQIRRLVVRQALLPTLLGLAVGLGAAVAVASLLAGLLHGVGPSDPATLIGVAVLFAGVSVFASYVPARRAIQVDPATSLRAE